MNNKKLIALVVGTSLLTTVLSISAYNYFAPKERPAANGISTDVFFSNYLDTADITVPEGLNFIASAEASMPKVVHIRVKVKMGEESSSDPLLKKFFDEIPMQEGSGSGVIMSNDGYIITNNHVVENATEIRVILNDKREYEATLIGTDPSTDLAVIKIEGSELPAIKFGNSDNVRIGQWVLAVGNPFELESTVTAGIVSAKGRNINLLRTKSNLAIESFIQTDAAVNPGNSGGALVNLKGELVGINSAIASPTGAFAGYSFAVPVNIVKRVTADLMEYGEVQRALLGISIQEMTQELADNNEMSTVRGVYVAAMGAKSGAKDAGIKVGDIILAINDKEVNSPSELQECVAGYRPGNTVTVTILRDGKEEKIETILKNKYGTTDLVEANATEVDLGVELVEVSSKDMEEYNITFGVKVLKLKEGKLKDAGVEEGFVITHIDKHEVKTVENFNEIMAGVKGGVLIEGVYPDGKKDYYAIGK